MKTRQQIVDMLRAIKRAVEDDKIDCSHGTAQTIVLAWVLDVLPPAAEAFQNFILDYKSPPDFNAAMLIENALESVEQTNIAIEEAIR